MIFNSNNSKKIRKSFFISIIVVGLSTITACIPKEIKQTELITDYNRHLIGKETSGDYMIYRNGVYIDSNGVEYSPEELKNRTRNGLPENRIITKIMEENYMPPSIFELETKEKNGVYISPEIITVNGSLNVLTDTNGSGWELKAGDSVEYVFEKYKSEVVENQIILIGYVKDGVLYPSHKFDQLKGNYNLTVEETGQYYFYIINASSDTIALKEGALRLTKNN
ncbi:hypothetical protein [Paenibacillus lautus]|uniref:Uncharacterized protein n=1 Tax=Paenibacillus lautus TaxID=1401 RepID=A0A385TP63_PAELA|nr:hypothetical protein [Paenibacillus lautus]AYB44382.1 hypothetical protein D5F53_14275 [Paenibacillus lautus]MBY0161992.1 hypothetical protein [Cytobacillus firmus]